MSIRKALKLSAAYKRVTSELRRGHPRYEHTAGPGARLADKRGLRHFSVRPNHLAAPARRRASQDVPPPLGEVEAKAVRKRDRERELPFTSRKTPRTSDFSCLSLLANAPRERDRERERERDRKRERERERERERRDGERERKDLGSDGSRAKALALKRLEEFNRAADKEEDTCALKQVDACAFDEVSKQLHHRVVNVARTRYRVRLTTDRICSKKEVVLNREQGTRNNEQTQGTRNRR